MGDPPFGQRTDFGNRQGQDVSGHRHRFGVEVATREHVAVGAEYQWVVRNRVGFTQEYASGETQVIQAGAHDLRLAAQRVRILDPRAVDMRSANLTVRQQFTIELGDVDLPGLTTDRLDAWIEGHVRAFQGFHAQAAGDHGGVEQLLGGKQPT